MSDFMRALVLIAFGAWLIGSIYWALCCAWIAREKERDQATWFALGFLLWLGAYLPLAAAPDLTEYED